MLMKTVLTTRLPVTTAAVAAQLRKNGNHIITEIDRQRLARLFHGHA